MLFAVAVRSTTSYRRGRGQKRKPIVLHCVGRRMGEK